MSEGAHEGFERAKRWSVVTGRATRKNRGASRPGKAGGPSRPSTRKDRGDGPTRTTPMPPRWQPAYYGGLSSPASETEAVTTKEEPARRFETPADTAADTARTEPSRDKANGERSANVHLVTEITDTDIPAQPAAASEGRKLPSRVTAMIAGIALVLGSASVTVLALRARQVYPTPVAGSAAPPSAPKADVPPPLAAAPPTVSPAPPQLLPTLPTPHQTAPQNSRPAASVPGKQTGPATRANHTQQRSNTVTSASAGQRANDDEQASEEQERAKRIETVDSDGDQSEQSTRTASRNQDDDPITGVLGVIEVLETPLPVLGG